MKVGYRVLHVGRTEIKNQSLKKGKMYGFAVLGDMICLALWLKGSSINIQHFNTIHDLVGGCVF